MDEKDTVITSASDGKKTKPTTCTRADIVNRKIRSYSRQNLIDPNSAQIRKIHRNAGLGYFNTTGKYVTAKTFENHDCGCQKRCVDRIPEEARKRIFEMFWKMASFSAQNAFLCGLIWQTVPKTRRPRNFSKGPKSASNHYSFNVDGECVDVCKTYFLKTLQISDGRMSRAIRKMRMGEPPGSDNRGCHSPGNKISEERMDEVRRHIESLPSFHEYRKYLNKPNKDPDDTCPRVTVRHMYELYKQVCVRSEFEPVKEHIYRRTFNEMTVQLPEDDIIEYEADEKITAPKRKKKTHCTKSIKQKKPKIESESEDSDESIPTIESVFIESI